MAELFKKTDKQIEACDLMAKHYFTLLYGGRRSAKTFIYVRNLFVRALKFKSRHILLRLTAIDIRETIWDITLPEVLRICFPELKKDVHYSMNKSAMTVKLYNGSSLNLGGLDDTGRVEKILGKEYSTALLNEVSQLPYGIVEVVISGLAEKSGLALKIWADCNPPGTKHWTYKLFIEGVHPVTGKPVVQDRYGSLLMNPIDNVINLGEGYMTGLDELSPRKRDRFRDGKFASDIEGALWNDEMIQAAQYKKEDDFKSVQTVIALDPNVADEIKLNSDRKPDEAGIGVISKDRMSRNSEGNALVEADLSGMYSTTQWAKKTVQAYHDYDARCVVAEVNQGGALVKDALRAVDPNIPIIMVHASKGKYARAEPVTVIYNKGQVKHRAGLDKLETEMMEYVPETSKKSPNRLDWMVWGITHLFMGNQSIPSIRSR